MVVSPAARYTAKRCSQYSDSVLGPVGTFVFVFGWVGYQGSMATRGWWFDRGRAGVGISPSASSGSLYFLVRPCKGRQYVKSCGDFSRSDKLQVSAITNVSINKKWNDICDNDVSMDPT